MKTMTHAEWLKKAEELFGPDPKHWRFVCPSCNTIQSAMDFYDAGVAQDTIQRQIAFSCIGRHTKGKGCDWTLGGLLQIHTLEVIFDNGPRPVFEFAEVKLSQDKIAGYFEVGANDNHEVVIQLPAEMVADFSPKDGGHIVFSPNQAENLANLLLKHAGECRLAMTNAGVVMK